MKLRKKQKSGDESYWKSFTDIMAGLLLIILLIMMLLLLYVTQINKEEHTEDYQYETQYDDDNDNENNNRSDHLADELYDRPTQEGGGGAGGGVDDPGDNDNEGIYIDIGHDKTAVFVTVVDEETENVIKKAGILFELYADRDAKGGLQILHTYYPEKKEYRQYETTKDGTFFLPEKITNGWYSLHNLRAPKGYSIADDVNFEITESLDWSEAYMVKVPMSPSKGVIYVHDTDADNNKNVSGTVYEVYAAEDVTTLDGTLRYKKGEKVDEFKTDESGKGESAKLYYGDYTVKQKTPATYYALNTDPLNVTLEYTETEAETHEIKCQKTRATLRLIDDYTEEPIKDAAYAVTGREDAVTDSEGRIILTDLEKNTTYDLTLKSLPDTYRAQTEKLSFTVDADGLIDRQYVAELNTTAYKIRLSVSARDMLFGNEITTTSIRLYDDKDTVVEEWEGTGTVREFENLDPGTYTVEVGGRKSTRVNIDLKDKGGVQTLATAYWTLWDTIAIFGGVLLLSLAVAAVIALIRRLRRKKDDE